MNSRGKLNLLALAVLIGGLVVALRLGMSGGDSKSPRPQKADSSQNSVTDGGRIGVSGERLTRRAGEKPGTHSLAKLVTIGEFPTLSQEQIEKYLSAQNRSAGSLLAAFRLSQDDVYLKEALDKFPRNPEVLLASLRQTTDPAKRLEVLATMKQENPDNGLIGVMMAKELFEAGRSDEAFAELQGSAGKVIDDFTLPNCQAGEEAYLSAGVLPAEAKFASLFTSTKPELIQSRNVSTHLVTLREKYEAAGDLESAAAVRAAQMELAQRLQNGLTVVDQLVGLVHEKAALKGLDSEEAAAGLEEIGQRSKELTTKSLQISELMKGAQVSESDWSLYFDRVKIFGEAAANEWVLEKYPSQ